MAPAMTDDEPHNSSQQPIPAARRTSRRLGRPWWWAALAIMLLAPALLPGAVLAKNPGAVQILTGHVEPRTAWLYLLPKLKKGNTLYLYMQTTSGNLDPVMALLPADFQVGPFRKDYRSRMDGAIKQGLDPFEVFPQIAKDHFLAWDDDGGQGHDAALKFKVPADGDYKLLVAGFLQVVDSKLSSNTFGDYRLTIGLNAPEVLTGRAASTGAVIARPDRLAFRAGARIQEIKGKLKADRDRTYYYLKDIAAGSTLSVFVEATSGDLKPTLGLRDYGRKMLRLENFYGKRKTAKFQYTFKEDAKNFSLYLTGQHGKTKTTGAYRLLVGLNAPEVLSGRAAVTGNPFVLLPIKVQVGLQMDQISEVNQRGENFVVVGDLKLLWQDPAFAFNPDTCQCSIKALERAQFDQLVAQNHLRWPRFIFFNQQGKRWTQQETFLIWPNGRVRYYERFSATLQAPDFNFKKFPFDSQKFFITLDCMVPEEFFVFENMPEFTRVGKQLGEEEWYITKFSTKVSSQEFGTRFSFGFEAQRHLSFYVFRIFIPLLLIIIVSWITFFLGDYSKRIDISGANLLVFIAFNFTIASDLPRLGYMTFLDAILISTFVVTALTVVFNVCLKRLDTRGRGELAQRIDDYVIGAYVVFYAVALGLLIFLFFYR